MTYRARSAQLWVSLLAAVTIPSVPSRAEGQTADAAPMPSEARRVSATFTGQPIEDVLQAFASYAGASIVLGSDVTGFVNADINDQPWDVALRAILDGMGLVAVEDEYGIIRVSSIVNLDRREEIDPIITRSYRISYSRAAEIQAAIAPLLSDRGSASVAASSNTLIVSDVARVQKAVSALLR